MSKLVWDTVGNKEYSVGIEKVVLFPQKSNGDYDKGVAWFGVTGVTEKPTGAEVSKFYADNQKYLNITSIEEFEATLEAYMSPEEFDVCDGTAEIATGVRIAQQTRRPFGLSYVSRIGNDTELDAHGYEIHLVYGCVAQPSEVAHKTINESVEVDPLSWELKTTPVAVTGYKPTSHLVVSSLKADPAKLAAFEAIIYGSSDTEPRLPLPDEVATLIEVTRG